MRLPFRGRPEDVPSNPPPPRAGVASARAARDAVLGSGDPATLAVAECDFGVALSQEGDIAAAISAFERAAALGDPDQTPRALRNIAAQHRRTGNARAANDLLRHVIAMRHPVWSRQAALNLADAYAADGDTASAVDVLVTVATWPERDDSAMARCVAARAHALGGEPEAARQAYEDALRCDDGTPSLDAALALVPVYRKAHDWPAAERVVRSALRIAASLGRGELECSLRIELGELLEKRHDVAAAREQFEQVARTASQPRQRAHGRLRIERSLLDEAAAIPSPYTHRRSARRAIENLQPLLVFDDPAIAESVRWLLGKAHGLAGDDEAARQMFVAAIDAAAPAKRPTAMLRYAMYLVSHHQGRAALGILGELATTASSEVAEPARRLHEWVLANT